MKIRVYYGHSFPNKKHVINRNYCIIMRLFKNIPAEKIGNFILTVITAFVSTFLMQSCGILH